MSSPPGSLTSLTTTTVPQTRTPLLPASHIPPTCPRRVADHHDRNPAAAVWLYSYPDCKPPPPSSWAIENDPTRPALHGTARLSSGSGSGSARLGSARLGSARLGSARLGSARLGSARLGSARLGSIRLGSAQLGSARHSLARLGSARLGSARLGSALGSTRLSSARGQNIRRAVAAGHQLRR